MSMTAGTTATAPITSVFVETVKKSTAPHTEPSSGTAYANDAALVTACLEGRPGAFATLMEQHQRRVYNLCYRFVGNHEDASDLSQEVFLRVHRGLHRFQGGAALSTWLYRIAVNVSLNHVGVKRPITEPVEPERLFDRQSESAVEMVARGERSAQVRAAIAKLPAMGVFPLLKHPLPVVVAFLLPATDTLDHRRVGNGTHRHGLLQEPMEELPAMA